MEIGDKISEEQWLDSYRDDPEAFGQILKGELQRLTGTGIGPQCNLHYSNVRIAYTHLYGFDMEGVGANASLVTRSGNQGNIAELRVPASAGLLRKAFNIVVGPELTWSAIATTTDFASEAQAVTARNALEYYWRQEMMGVECKAAQFESMAFAESALHIPWDVNAGKPVGVDTTTDPKRPRLLTAGDMRFARIPTWDIFRDPTAHSRESLTFVIVREWPNKYDVAASCDTEEKRAKCLASGASPPSAQAWLPFRVTYDSNTKRIPVYYLYALRSPSVAQGRMTRFLEDGTVLDDAPLDERYVDLPGTIGAVVWTTSGSYAGTPWPYSKWFGTLGIDQARDGLRRDLLTNATATSGNVISVPEDQMDMGAAVAFENGGPQLIPRKPGGGKDDVPIVLQLQQSHPEHFKLDQTLGGEAQQIMGIDQLTNGNMEALPSSGALGVLLTSMSVQNNSQEQKDFVNLVTRAGNLVLRHIQKMPQPKRIALAGNARSALVTTTEVDGSKIQGIERVIATIGSARQQTEEGRYQIATEALKAQWVKTPEQFQTVLDTGRMDALNEDLSNALLLIKSENEALSRGENPSVMLEDDHRLHIKGHASVMASITARKNPAAVAAVQQHNDAHIRALRESDPELIKAMGQEPLTPQGPPGMPGPGGHPPPMPGGPKPPQMEQKAQAPSMPTNPADGQKAIIAGGTPPPALAIKPN